MLILANRYQISVPLPFTPGSEFSGVVESVGEGVTEWAPGDRVFGSTMVGAFADYVVCPRPPFAGFRTGSTSNRWRGSGWRTRPLQQARSVGEVRPGDRVLVLGAAGGVGLAAVELAACSGAEVIAAASSPAKLVVCRERGAAHTIDYSTDDLRAQLRIAAPDGLDVVIDPVGGPMAELALRSTKWGGRFSPSALRRARFRGFP